MVADRCKVHFPKHTKCLLNCTNSSLKNTQNVLLNTENLFFLNAQYFPWNTQNVFKTHNIICKIHQKFREVHIISQRAQNLFCKIQNNLVTKYAIIPKLHKMFLEIHKTFPSLSPSLLFSTTPLCFYLANYRTEPRE